MTVATDAVEAVRESVRRTPRLLPVAGATKPALSTPGSPDVTTLDVSGLRGIVEYDPAELTFTALAATPVAEVAAVLAEHGQHLPFDPPLAARGATLGGVVAAGTSGPGALRHGGVRDFIIGVRLVDGTGTLVSGGGRVVKNAAGFDLPKLMVGSLGRLGVMVSLSFKVFPRPRATSTSAFALGSTDRALAAAARLARGPLELEAIDVDPGGRLLTRLGGDADGLAARVTRLTHVVGAPAEAVDEATWDDVADLRWAPADTTVVRVATTVRSAGPLTDRCAGAAWRVSLAGGVTWLAWPADGADALDALLGELGLTGVALTGAPGRPLLGRATGGAFGDRVRAGMDPGRRFAGA